MAFAGGTIEKPGNVGRALRNRAPARFWSGSRSIRKRWRGFLHEVRVEMRQVTWPTRHEVVVTTWVVIVAVAFFGVFFFGVDSTRGLRAAAPVKSFQGTED